MNTDSLRQLKPPIAVIGLGKSGTSALNLLRASGFSDEQVITFDEKNPAARCRTPGELLELAPRTLVVSPGVPLSSPWLRQLRDQGALITSEISLAARLLDGEKLIGVTGSVGKSTVTSLLGAGARTLDPRAFVGGNLGIPFCDYALQVLRGSPRAAWVILELSSYQLENCENLRLNFSAISFLSSNHLERYDSLEAYYRTKLEIAARTTGICFLNASSADVVRNAPAAQALAGAARVRLVNAAAFSRPDLLPHVYLLGAHNKDNFALAAELALAAGWPEESLLEMARYRGLPHRLEFVATLNNVTYINDSKATAMDSVLVAVRGCQENLAGDGRLYVLLGGKDKNLPWQDLGVLGTRKASTAAIVPVFFGACGELAREKSGLGGEYFEKLGSAINFAQKRAQPGDAVLLSPGGTSLDEFKNFEERGDFFKTLVLSSVEA